MLAHEVGVSRAGMLQRVLDRGLACEPDALAANLAAIDLRASRRPWVRPSRP